MKKLFFVCGSHCCGKTTVLKKLEDDGFISFNGSELGTDLFLAQKFITENQNEDFELELANLELERDIKILDNIGVAGVETWHPGNLAYAAVRNPRIVSALCEIAHKSPLINNAFGVWLNIDTNVIRNRTKVFKDRVDWACEFYEKVNSQMDNCLKMLGIRERVEIIDANRPLEDVLFKVKDVIKRYTSHSI